MISLGFIIDPPTDNSAQPLTRELNIIHWPLSPPVSGREKKGKKRVRFSIFHSYPLKASDKITAFGKKIMPFSSTSSATLTRSAFWKGSDRPNKKTRWHTKNTRYSLATRYHASNLAPSLSECTVRVSYKGRQERLELLW
jgi:hypothetical protein